MADQERAELLAVMRFQLPPLFALVFVGLYVGLHLLGRLFLFGGGVGFGHLDHYAESLDLSAENAADFYLLS